MADESYDPPGVIGRNSHATSIQGVEDGVGKTVAERGLDVVLSQHVHRTADGEAWEAFGADPSGLALVDEGDSVSLHGAGDGCGFTVIEGLGCRAGDERREVRSAGLPESRVLDEVLLDQHGQNVGTSAARLSADLKFQKDIFDDDTAVR